ncbi:aminopeptidase [Alkalihalobacillus sp. AL-G]|uniref:aminopeptidase n=1 Tax=Alkalihalobacillus sp. AL-G TaxID=2926399 RepID=UPI0027297128|nr:aminopeptidase [Alkalihalobacillus sp. AL-G]WLD92401.1 aminopeptidase [Alkalihalobacillus sp. AL-G]
MRDPRIQSLANNIITYSVSLQPGEKVLIENTGYQKELVNALVEEAHKAGGHPYVTLKDETTQRALLMDATEEQLEAQGRFEKAIMKEMDAYVAIRSGDNISELSDVPSEKMAMYQNKVYTPVHRTIRIPKTKWTVLRYPNSAMAQLADMSSPAFEDLYFNVCNLDYSNMLEAMKPLADLMDRTDIVHIKGPGTDLKFSIKDIPSNKSAGHHNLPDGEVYTAPVRESVNGIITYNAPSPYQGFVFENISLTFKDGKVIEATANDSERINKVLDTDEGARYIGEFAIGVNPYIQNPMQDILFDEKIDGSFHFTPGQCYDQAFNGNNSDIHWDMVCIQRPEYGGGEIYFDGVLIRKDGRFILPELEALNPENLK